MIVESWRPELPPLPTLAWLAPLLAAWVLGAGALSGWLRLQRGWRAGDTRKLLHFVVFSTAVVLAWRGGPAAVNVLGGVMSIFVLAALWRGEGTLFYAAMARDSDRPRAGLHIVIPLAATAAGGIASSWIFGPWAAVGYVACGWGDAVGEPVGVRWGRHRYRVPGLGGVTSHRSVEGSAAVVVASFLGAAVVLAVSPPADFALGRALVAALAVAGATGAAECVTHHGLDNFTVQVAASAAAWAVLG